MKVIAKIRRNWELILFLALFIPLFSIISLIFINDFIWQHYYPHVDYMPSRHDEACHDIVSLTADIDIFRSDNHQYPNTQDGLQLLVKNPDIKKYPNYRQLLKELPADPWGNSFIYTLVNKKKFTIVSYGSDAKPGGKGDAKDIFISDCGIP